MQRHKKLKARILSLVLSAMMVVTNIPTNVLAAREDGILPDADASGIIVSFDELEDRFQPSVGKDASKDVYTLAVELDTPVEDLRLPDELTAMVARTTVTAPAEDEIIPDEEKPVDEDTDTDDTVSDNQPASPSDAEEEVKEEIKDEDVPLAPEPEQDKETVVTTVEQETISVTWKSDKEYKSDENGKFIYTAVLPEGYILADGVKLPQIYVFVGRQARSATTHEVATMDALRSAAAAVNEDDIIKLTADITTSGGSYVDIKKSLTLDLNNYTLTKDGTVLHPVDSASLTVVDSSSSKNGKILATGGAVIENYGTGTVTISSGTVTSTGNSGYAIFNSKTGNIVISGGTVSATGSSGTAIYNYTTGKITISQANPEIPTVVASANTSNTGGTIYLYAVSATGDNKVILDIQGGTVSNTATPTVGNVICFDTSPPVTSENLSQYYTKAAGATVTGSMKPEPAASTAVAFTTLTANGTANTADTTELTLTFDKDVADLAATDITVTGATKGALAKQSGTGVYKLAISNITVVEGANVNVAVAKTGFTFSPANMDVAVHKAASGGGHATITTSIDCKNFNADKNCTNTNSHTGTPCWSWNNTAKKLTLNGVTSSTSNSMAFYLPADATIELTDGSMNSIATTGSGQRGIYCHGSATIQGAGTLTISAAGSEGLYLATSGTALTINGGTINITALGAAIVATNDNAAISITGGTITAESTGNTSGYGVIKGGSIAISGGKVSAKSATGTFVIKPFFVEPTCTNGIASTGAAWNNTTGTAAVYEVASSTAVAFSTLTANGTANTTDTTELTLTFDKDVADLAATDITLTGATKGTLTKQSGTGVYKLAISAITVNEGANVNVAVAKTGFTFNPTNMDVAVHKAASGGLAHDISTDSLTLTSTCTCTDSNPHVVTGTTTANNIDVQSGTHYVTMDGVSIDVSATNSACAFNIASGATVNLTLKDNTTSTLKSGQSGAGLQVPTGAAISIGGSGTLTVTGGEYGAGIGGGYNAAGGTISISGGNVTAAGNAAAGIGGGYQGAGGTISISGGNVTVTTIDGGAGIGGGMLGAGGNISISGGTVTATGSNTAAAVGGGQSGAAATSLTLTGMEAKYKVGSDYTGSTNVSGNKIYQGTAPNIEATDVKITAASGGLNHNIGTDGPLTLTDGDSCSVSSPHVITGATATDTTTDVVTVSSGTHYITLNNVTIDAKKADGPFAINAGTVYLTLKDGTTNTLTAKATQNGEAYAGLYVASGATLVIDGTGSLAATGSKDSMMGVYGAGIGGNSPSANRDAGTITIKGGTVTASGVYGIGGGASGASKGTASGVTISGTNTVVTATGFPAAAAVAASSLTLTGMEAKYKVNAAYTGATNISANKIYEGTTQTTEAKDVKITQAATLPDYTGTQAAAPSSTPVSKTDTQIVLAAVTVTGETIEYAKSTGTTAPATDADWQTGTTFTGLTADTQYYFFARVKASTTHKAGTASSGTAIKTDKTETQKVAAAKTLAQTALTNMTATNATTADDVLGAINTALADSGVTAVWDASGAFDKTLATDSAAGSVTGTIKLTCGKASDTVSVNLPIARLGSDEEKAASAKTAAVAALSGYIATNATVDSDIMTLINKAITDAGITGVTATWKSGSGFDKTEATVSATGIVTGIITLTINSATADVTVNLTIAQLADKATLTTAITAANNAKTGISVNDNPASSVTKGRKFVTTAEMKALTDAIAAAQAVSDNPASTAAQVSAAITALNNAVTTFNAAIKTGTHTSSGGGGGSSSSQTIYTSVPPKYTGGTKIIGNVRVPDYTVEGTWKKNANGTWNFSGMDGKTYANSWAPVFNPYADVPKGQSAFDWFLFDANGTMMTGWYTDAEGNIYYLNPNSDNTLGAMQTGWVLIDGKYYYFNEMPDGTRGKLFQNTRTPDGYLVDKNGVWDGSDK